MIRVLLQRVATLVVVLSLASGVRAEVASRPDNALINKSLQFKLQAEVLRPAMGITPATPVVRGTGVAPPLKLVVADRIKEGEVVLYTVRISNPHPQPVDDGMVVLPVPANTQVIANSMTGAGAQIDCSADMGTTFVNESDLPKPALSAFGHAVLPCTHLRWRLKSPLPAGAVLLARFRAEFH